MKPRLRRVLALALAAGTTVCLLPAPSAAQYLSAQEVLSADPVEADFVLAYGKEPEQFGHLRLPKGSGPFPVLVIIHGGCWLSFVQHTGATFTVAQLVRGATPSEDSMNPNRVKQ